MAGKILTVFFLIACTNVITIKSFKLKQVLLLGRHNVRTPLTENLDNFTPKIWPEWEGHAGLLTEKGAILENYMGEYFAKWLHQKKLFNGCPDKKSVYIYANARARTKETAEIFAKAAFRNCNVHVYVKPNVATDPVFHPVILNMTEPFKSIVMKEMQDKLNSLQLNEAYSLLNSILDYNNSQTCKNTDFCDLTGTKDEIVYKFGEEPDITGPLQVGNAVVDAFLMSYYNGLPVKNIAWGHIKTETFGLLTKITKENQNVRFNSTNLGRHVARPLLKLFYQVFSNDDLKFTLLMGHDSNLNSMIASLGFQPFDLEHNWERTPVGGKLVFQKLHDEENDKYYAKINFIYQSTAQLRNGTPLSLENPPKSAVLKLLDCKTDQNGHCPWQDFIGILERLQ